jgi:hypothetical protein
MIAISLSLWERLERAYRPRSLHRNVRPGEDQLTQALAARDNAGAAKAELIVNGVRADPTEGADSALIEAMGYTRKSERKSGLTRKKQGGTQPNP